MTKMKKNPHAVKLGKRGGDARASLPLAERQALARTGGIALWRDHQRDGECACAGCRSRSRKRKPLYP
jgi:hypothetical protein